MTIEVRGSRRSWLPSAVAGSTLVAAAIHVAVIPEHLGESSLFAAGFALMALTQAASAEMVMMAPSRRTYASSGVVNAGIALLWLISRTAGLPVGPHPWIPETVSFLDAAATGLEVAAVIGAMILTFEAMRIGEEVRRERMRRAWPGLGAARRTRERSDPSCA
jgi:hypothetical protein